MLRSIYYPRSSVPHGSVAPVEIIPASSRKPFRDRAKNRSPSRRNHCSQSARNRVHLRPGTLFTFTPESRSPCPGIRKTLQRSTPLSEALTNTEKEMIEAALEETGGRVSGPSGAAVKLGIKRSTLESRIRSLQINKHLFRSERRASITGNSITSFPQVAGRA